MRSLLKSRVDERTAMRTTVGQPLTQMAMKNALLLHPKTSLLKVLGKTEKTISMRICLTS
jgi:hypothetical protein